MRRFAILALVIAPAGAAAVPPASRPAPAPAAPAGAPTVIAPSAPAAPGSPAPAPAAPAASGASAPRPAKPVEIKPYVPPRIDPEPPIVEADTPVVKVPEDAEATVVVRPGPGMPMVGSAVPGALLPVRGMWDAPTPRRCAGRRWYALEPFGWVCGNWVRRSEEPPSREPVLKVPEGRSVPFEYVMVGVKKDESVPLWANVDDMKAEAEPLYQLRKGDTVAVKVEPPLKWKGVSYYVAEDGRVLPVKPTFRLGERSAWSGAPLDDRTHLPLAWVTPRTANVYDDAAGGRVIDRLVKRARVDVLEESGTGHRRRVRIGEGRWLRAVDVNEVRRIARPRTVTGHDRWIDVDLGEQVLVAYEADRPVFATLISSGRAIPTPRGSYPIWGKVSHITMKSQPYDDEPYYVDRVPWVLFFQAHNAIHGAYWHDLFGITKSHGCVNVAPRDARWLFEWVPPGLPAAWSGLRTPNLLEGVTVHVRNSVLRKSFEQERNIGPPDREEERLKLEEAEARRLAEAAAAPPPPPGAPPALPAPGPAAPPATAPRP
jgi:hypothetical protein